MSLRKNLINLVQAGYQGEVLYSDGTDKVLPDGVTIVPYMLEINGPHYLFCGCDNENLWVYYDTPSSGDFSGGTIDQIHRLARAERDNFAPHLQATLALNGPYTLFLTPADCHLALDLRYLFADDPEDFDATSALGGDLDVVALHSGHLRMTFVTHAGGLLDTDGDHVGDLDTVVARGLVCAYGPMSACVPANLPSWIVEDEAAEEPPAALPVLAARIRALGPAVFQDPTALRELYDEFIDAACVDGLMYEAGGEIRSGPHPLAAAFHALANRPENLRGQRAIAALANRPENLRGQRALAALMDCAA